MYTVEVKDMENNNEWRQVKSGKSYDDVLSTVNLFAVGFGGLDSVRVKKDGVVISGPK